jgi:hypothetical protein
MNGGCVENAMDSSSIFLSVLRFLSYLSFLFPLFCRLHWLDTVGPAYALSIPIIHWIAFGCPTHFGDLILTLFYCSFSMVFRSARPHSLWYAGGLTYDHSSIIEVLNFSVPLVGWAHFFAFSPPRFKDWLKQPILLNNNNKGAGLSLKVEVCLFQWIRSSTKSFPCL